MPFIERNKLFLIIRISSNGRNGIMKLQSAIDKNRTKCLNTNVDEFSKK